MVGRAWSRPIKHTHPSREMANVFDPTEACPGKLMVLEMNPRRRAAIMRKDSADSKAFLATLIGAIKYIVVERFGEVTS